MLDNIEYVPQKSSELIWLVFRDMVRWKFYLTLKIRIEAFLVIMQYSMMEDLPAYAENSLQCRSEYGKKIKVKQSHYRPGLAQSVPRSYGVQIS